MWKRIPVDRIPEIEAVTGIPRSQLRPDLFVMTIMPDSVLDPVDQARAHEYGLLSFLLWKAPEAKSLARLASLRGDATPIGRAHFDLSLAAGDADPVAVGREFFDLFIGVSRGEVMPYASYYLTGLLHERPLARIREDFLRIGIERETGICEPEDHLAVLCDVMAGLIRGDYGDGADCPVSDRDFFERHLSRWAASCFGDMERAHCAGFYRRVGALGRLFIEIEREAFALPV
jgi:TorA maturation chaperone TorD